LTDFVSDDAKSGVAQGPAERLLGYIMYAILMPGITAMLASTAAVLPE
jgi:hypothetical protein